MKELRGIYPVQVTPFKENGDIDFDALAHNANWLVEKGVHGIVAVGSTGEYAAMSWDEQKQVAKTVIDTVAGRVPVIVGTTAETAYRVIDLGLAAKANGADALMILQPPYNNPTQEEMYVHFKTVADAVDLPIMLYNNPWSSGVDCLAETIIRLGNDCPNILYCKECTGGVIRSREISLGSNGKVKIFCGWDDLAYETFVLGAVGWVSMAANVFPELCVQLFDLCQEGKTKEAWAVYLRLLPWLRNLEYEGAAVQRIKYAATKRGLDCGVCRQPKLPLGDAEKKNVEAAIQDLL